MMPKRKLWLTVSCRLICAGTIHADSAREAMMRLQNEPMNVPLSQLPLIDIVIVLNSFREEGKSLRRIVEVAEVSGTEGKLVERNVMVNGVSTDHYTFDESTLGATLGLGVIAKAKGDVWVAPQYNVAIKYVARYEGEDLAIGGGESGVLDLTFDLTDLNAPMQIEAPEGSKPEQGVTGVWFSLTDSEALAAMDVAAMSRPRKGTPAHLVSFWGGSKLDGYWSVTKQDAKSIKARLDHRKKRAKR